MADALPRRGDRDRRGGGQLFRRAHGRFQDSGKAQGAVPPGRRRRAAREGHRARGGHRADLQQQHRAVHDARTGARQPHPAQDRRQGRRGRQSEGGRRCSSRRKRGADFAELAKKNSEDEGSAKNGGDLDYFGRGRMVPEFDQAVFTMSPARSAISSRPSSGITSSSWSIRRPASDRARCPRCGSRSSISSRTRWRRRWSPTWRRRSPSEITKPADLDKAAQKHGLTVQESGFFARDEPILTLGASPDAVAKAFDDEDRRGLRPAAVGARHRVRDARRGAAAVAAEARRGKGQGPRRSAQAEVARPEPAEGRGARGAPQGRADFEKAAKAAGVEAKSTELITRDAPIPDLGLAPAVLDAAFSCRSGAVSDPITTETGTIVFKVVAKEEVTPAQWASNRDEFRDELLADRRNRFFASYMSQGEAEDEDRAQPRSAAAHGRD